MRIWYTDHNKCVYKYTYHTVNRMMEEKDRRNKNKNDAKKSQAQITNEMFSLFGEFMHDFYFNRFVSFCSVEFMAFGMEITYDVKEVLLGKVDVFSSYSCPGRARKMVFRSMALNRNKTGNFTITQTPHLHDNIIYRWDAVDTSNHTSRFYICLAIHVCA